MVTVLSDRQEMADVRKVQSAAPLFTFFRRSHFRELHLSDKSDNKFNFFAEASLI